MLRSAVGSGSPRRETLREGSGSGYSWWDFQSNRNNPVMRRDSLGQPVFSQPLGVSGNWLSPLGYGDGVNPWRIKKLADTLDSYVLPPEAQELPAAPYNYPSWLGFESEGIQTWGWVKDQNNEPVADAVIEWNWNYTTGPGQSDFLFPNESAWDRITTFGDGYFQVPRPEPIVAGWRRDSTSKGGVAFHGGMGFQDLQNEAPGALFTLPRFGPRVSDTTEFEWPDIGESISYLAYNDLVVTDQFISGIGDTGAVANYSARFNVHVIGEFHAMAGSETHLFNEQTWPDCNAEEYRNAQVRVTPPPTAATAREVQQPVTLSLKFDQPSPELVVAPNPATDRITVFGLHIGRTCTIADGSGRVSFTTSPVSTTLSIDTSLLTQGQYVLCQGDGAGMRSVQFQILR